MANMTKSTVSSLSGGGPIVSGSNTASKAGSDLVTGMADYQRIALWSLLPDRGRCRGTSSMMMQ